MEEYHPYRQYVEIILSIWVTNWLLWLLFDAGYRKNMYNMDRYIQGQITPNLENKHVLKPIYFVAQCLNTRSKVLFLKHVLHNFSAFVQFSAI